MPPANMRPPAIWAKSFAVTSGRFCKVKRSRSLDTEDPLYAAGIPGKTVSPLCETAIGMPPDWVTPAMAFLGALDHIGLVDFYSETRPLWNGDIAI
jgi:hypothetical protein